MKLEYNTDWQTQARGTNSQEYEIYLSAVDKKTGLKTAHNALKLCVEELIKMAKEKDIDLLYTVTADKALQKRYLKYHGLSVAEKSATTFLKNISKKNYNDLDWITDG